jgi:hypothetical protein
MRTMLLAAVVAAVLLGGAAAQVRPGTGVHDPHAVQTARSCQPRHLLLI